MEFKLAVVEQIPAQMSGIEVMLPEITLVGNVMDGEQGLNFLVLSCPIQVGMAIVKFPQKNRPQTCLPIVGVKEVRGKGLLIGIVLESNEAKNVAEKLQQRGFLTNPASENVIRIAPAFIVTEPQILKFVSAFNAVCEEVYHG
ncbi:MAG: hypothetical protein RJB59_827 [Actinomycetota bacterium]